MTKLQQILSSQTDGNNELVDGNPNTSDYKFATQKEQVEQADAQNSYNPTPMSQAKSCPLGGRTKRQIFSSLNKYEQDQSPAIVGRP